MDTQPAICGLWPIGSLIRDALESFGRDELAYLALTSKPEGALRDRIAFRMHCDVTKRANGWLIAREFSRAEVATRVDLAVLDEKRDPLAFIEFKSTYAFDGVNSQAKQEDLAHAIRGDIDKLRVKLRGSERSTEMYSITAITNPCQRIPEDLHDVIKYAREINRGFRAGSVRDGRSSDEVAVGCMQYLCRTFTEDGMRVVDVPVKIGSAFGIAVELHWVAVGPIDAGGSS